MDNYEVKNSNKFGFSLGLTFGLKCSRSTKRKIIFSLLQWSLHPLWLPRYRGTETLDSIFFTTFNPPSEAFR